MSVSKTRGFSMVELLIVVSIMLIVLGVSFIQIAPMFKESQAQTALQTTLGQMRRAHEMAVDQRQVYRLTFTAPGTIQLDQVGIDPTTGAKTYTLQSTMTLPSQIQFAVVTGLPNTTATAPDNYGTGATAIDFDRDFGGGGTQIYFQRDGRALDSSNRINNGLIYMCRPGQLLSCKAVSLIGATGRSKGWMLTQSGAGVAWSALGWTQ